jgi:hypothetical protein
MADTTPPPASTTVAPHSPLSAEAKAFRFWLCRLPWVVFFAITSTMLLDALMGDPRYPDLTSFNLFADKIQGIALFMLFMPLVGYIRLSWRVLTKLSTLSISQMRLIAWTSSVRVVWLSWPQWLASYCIVGLYHSFDNFTKIMSLTIIIGPYILGITGIVTFIFSTAWELELLIRRLFRRKG